MTKHFGIRVLWVFLAWVAIVQPVRAQQQDQTLERRAEAIYNKLNCPVCAGQTVESSNSEVAKEMRRVIREMLREGKSEQEILQYFVDRYGEWILAVPPRRGVNRLLWWIPVVVFLTGGGMVWAFYTWVRSRTPEPQMPDIPEETLQKIDRLLKEEEEES